MLETSLAPLLQIRSHCYLTEPEVWGSGFLFGMPNTALQQGATKTWHQWATFSRSTAALSGAVFALQSGHLALQPSR